MLNQSTSADPVSPTDASGKREMLMSPAEAQKRNKALPKGYAFEPVYDSSAPIESPTVVTGKRERRKKKENPEFVTAPEEVLFNKHHIPNI